jgi:hypothetical protein
MSSKLNYLTLAGEIVRVKIRTGLLTHKALFVCAGLFTRNDDLEQVVAGLFV